MLFEELLARNAAFARTRRPQALEPPGTRQLAILACYDPRLDDLIRPALGLAMGEAILVRSAGAAITPAGDPMRSLALAVYLFDVREIAVLGHAACRMAQFDSASFIDAFRKRHVARDAFGTDDLRRWTGALSSPAEGVRQSVSLIRAAPFLPRDLVVSGLLLDDATGVVSVVVRPDEGVETGTLPATAASFTPQHGDAASSSATPTFDQGHQAAPAHAAAPAAREAPPPLPADQGLTLARAVVALKSFLQTIESKSVWSGALQQLRADIQRERNPAARVTLIRAFLRRAAADSRDVLDAFEVLREAAAAAEPLVDRQALVDLFRPPSSRERR
jgi:carbonic anhydrase